MATSAPRSINIKRTAQSRLDITAPTRMTIPAIADTLLAYHAEQEAPMDFTRQYPGISYFDGLVAFQQVLCDRYGLITSAKGERPRKLSIATADGLVECFYGPVTTPFIGNDGYLAPTHNWTNTGVDFRIDVRCKGKQEGEARELLDALETYLREHSIYTGHAIHLSYAYIWDSNNVEFDTKEHMPRFMNDEARRINPNSLIFSESTERLIEATIFSVIRNTPQLIELGIPLKRGALLAGQYGIGKTMLANAIAHICIDNGWTFFLCSDARDYPYALAFAKAHQPAVVFCEDIDRLVKGQHDAERSTEIDKVLNTIDGIEFKNASIMSIFTTNDVESIHPSFLRPGRIDTHVHIELPDAGAAIRLCLAYASDAIDPRTDFESIGEALANQTPAQIREVVERAKLYTLARTGTLHAGDLTCDDLILASKGMTVHRQLCEPRRPDLRSEREKAASTLADAISTGIADIRATIEDIADLNSDDTPDPVLTRELDPAVLTGS